MQPLIDVLMPVYNAGWSLPETLASIQAQTVRNIRIIVVDDGSTDNTPDVLAAAAAADPRIHVITQANGGIVFALNAGLAVCTALFVARHDADDLSEPERFERQMRYLEINLDCVALAGPARQIDALGRDLGAVTKLRDLAKADEEAVPAYEPYLLHPMLMVRREAIQAVGGYRSVFNAEDSDLYWRLRERGKLHNLSELLGSYRMHGGSLTSQSIETGRRGALYAQLAAISAQRRARNENDLIFNDELSSKIKSLSSLEELYAAACHRLNKREQNWLALALSAKLIELCFYRPFELTQSDCLFIHWAIDKHRTAMPENSAATVRNAMISTAVRLGQSGKYRNAITLVGLKLLPIVAIRLGFRVALPDALKDRVKRLAGRGRT